MTNVHFLCPFRKERKRDPAFFRYRYTVISIRLRSQLREHPYVSSLSFRKYHRAVKQKDVRRDGRDVRIPRSRRVKFYLQTFICPLHWISKVCPRDSHVHAYLMTRVHQHARVPRMHVYACAVTWRTGEQQVRKICTYFTVEAGRGL